MNNNFTPEAALINKDDNRQEIQARRNEQEEYKKNLEAAYKKAVSLLDGERIDPNKFKGLYSDEIIKEHEDYVESRQNKFKAINNVNIKNRPLKPAASGKCHYAFTFSGKNN